MIIHQSLVALGFALSLFGQVHGAPVSRKRKRTTRRNNGIVTLSPSSSPTPNPSLDEVRAVSERLEELEFTVTLEDEAVIRALLDDNLTLERQIRLDEVFNEMIDTLNADIGEEDSGSEYEDGEDGDSSKFSFSFV